MKENKLTSCSYYRCSNEWEYGKSGTAAGVFGDWCCKDHAEYSRHISDMSMDNTYIMSRGWGYLESLSGNDNTIDIRIPKVMSIVIIDFDKGKDEYHSPSLRYYQDPLYDSTRKRYINSFAIFYKWRGVRIYPRGIFGKAFVAAQHWLLGDRSWAWD